MRPTPLRRRNAAKKRTVLITRPRGQAESLAAPLESRGFRIVLAPAIRITPPASWTRLDRALRNLNAYDVVVFTSANGVEKFFARARRTLGRAPAKPPRLYAIGPATSRALARRGWRGVRVPETHEGGALARFLGRVRGKRILIPRAAVARDVLPRILSSRGASVEVVEAYRTVADARGRRRIRRLVRDGGVDIVTFTSPSTVEQFMSAAGRDAARRFLRSAACASIGPVTSAALRRHGITPPIEAETYNAQGLIRAIVRFFRKREKTDV